MENSAFIAKVRIEGLRDLGSAPSPFNSFQSIQGIESLDIRMKKHSENALKLAAWLSTKEEVAWVNYPGLKTSKYNTLAQKYLPKGQSGIVTFGLKKGFEAGKKVADHTQLFSLLANIGDTKSLLIHPASTTHSQLNEKELANSGVTQSYVRLCIGLEHIDDIIDDLDQALNKSSNGNLKAVS